MKQVIKHGATIDAVTPDELAAVLKANNRRDSVPSRVRAPQQVRLDANGNGQVEVYKVPAGMEFAVRRVVFDLDLTGGNPTPGQPLGANAYLIYRRSGQIIEYAQPEYAGTFRVPGVQTWGSEQGPYLRNDEVFEVQAVGLSTIAPGGILTIVVEGILGKRSVEAL